MERTCTISRVLFVLLLVFAFGQGFLMGCAITKENYEHAIVTGEIFIRPSWEHVE